MLNDSSHQGKHSEIIVDITVVTDIENLCEQLYL